MGPLSGTARRVIGAFAALIALYCAAAAFALRGLDEVHGSLHHVKDREADVRAALELSRAVRDQYAHQAHSIILGDATHLQLYEQSRDRVRVLLGALTARVVDASDRQTLVVMSRTSGEIDRLFRDRLLPAVLARDAAVVGREHAGLLALVARIEAQADALADRFESQIGRFEEHADTVQHVALRWTIVLLVAAIAFAAIVGVYIVRSVAGPVAILEAGASRIAAGDLTSGIDIRADDEFGRLARQFNSMTSSLAAHQARLVQTEKLATVGRLAAGVAHELNNPLGVILGYTRLLARKAAGELRSDLQVIEDETRRCQEIVEGLLDFARPVRVDDVVVELREVADAVVERLGEAGLRKGVRVEVRGAARVRGAELRLRQVVTNMVRNAVDAAGEGGAVTVEITKPARAGAPARLAVADTGPGVDAEHRGRLFEPFFTTRASGTGLGLAVSRAIARAHGGELDYSERPGGGALFTLLLPADRSEERG